LKGFAGILSRQGPYGPLTNMLEDPADLPEVRDKGFLVTVTLWTFWNGLRIRS
jgi:hypothetical protein